MLDGTLRHADCCILQELLYWGIEEQDIEACCWADYSKYTEHKEALRDLDDNFAFVEDDVWEDNDSRMKKFADKMWKFLEDPSSSTGAKVSMNYSR